MKEIGDIVPINEKHRRKLERLKANLAQLKARQDEDAAVGRLETEIRRERAANLRELSQLRTTLNNELRESLSERERVQTELVLRIANKLRG